MNQEIKQKWIDALLSDEYDQGALVLRNGHEYCCLGVLCDLHSKETGKEWSHGLGTKYAYDGEREITSASVSKWAGFNFTVDEYGEPIFPDEINPGYLAGMNDSGSTFAELAEIIRDNL